jgi:ribosomal protein S18 acetylase RimI-like enzyme
LPANSRDKIIAEKPLEISRIYLRKTFWGKKLGSILLERCIAEAEKQNCDVIWLSVWQYNKRAIKFYEKFGFYQVGEHIFDLAGSPEIDFLMQKKLVNG